MGCDPAFNRAFSRKAIETAIRGDVDACRFHPAFNRAFSRKAIETYKAFKKGFEHLLSFNRAFSRKAIETAPRPLLARLVAFSAFNRAFSRKAIETPACSGRRRRGRGPFNRAFSRKAIETRR